MKQALHLYFISDSFFHSMNNYWAFLKKGHCVAVGLQWFFLKILLTILGLFWLPVTAIQFKLANILKTLGSHAWKSMQLQYRPSSLILGIFSLHLLVLHFSVLILFLDRSTIALTKWPPEVPNVIMCINLGSQQKEGAFPTVSTKVSWLLFIDLD